MNFNEENNNSNPESNPFSLPGNYFDSFSKKMMHKIELVEELKEFELLSALDKKSPFIVPAEYFACLSENAEFINLYAIKNTNVFVTPSNYFENSSKGIQNKIELEAEASLYPHLSEITKQNNFETPLSYFSVSHKTISDKLVLEKSARILHLVFNKKTAYAIAAMLVLSLGLYLFNSNTEAADSKCNTLACLDNKDIFKANQLMGYDVESLIELVNTEELSKNLNSTLENENRNAKIENVENYILDNIDVNEIADEI